MHLPRLGRALQRFLLVPAAVLPPAALLVAAITPSLGVRPLQAALAQDAQQITLQASAPKFPKQVAAGLVAVTLVSDGKGEAEAVFARLNPGVTLAQVQAANAAAQNPVPAFIRLTKLLTFVGGVTGLPAGSSETVVLDLRKPGLYGFNLTVGNGEGKFITFTVLQGSGQGTAPSDGVPVTVKEMKIEGMPREIAAGILTLTVSNTGSQPHELSLVRLDPGKTQKDMLALLNSPQGHSGPLPAWEHDAGGLNILSPHQRATLSLTFSPGYYVALSYTPDAKTGRAMHVMEGMITHFIVQAIGTRWINVTSNLANMPSQCGNLTILSAVPNSDRIIAGVALDGLWASNNSGASWSHLGTGSGSDAITNRPSWITYDPLNSTTFWESGIYSGNGAYRTADAGNTFQHLGAVTHDDFISVDYADPHRQTLLVGGHEQSQSVWKSSDGGQTWTNIGLNLPSGTGFSTDPLLITAQTYVVNADTSWGGGAPGIYRTTNGGTSWARVSSVDPRGAPLVAADGTIYWSSGDSLAKSTDKGLSWTVVGSGLSNNVHPIDLPDGRIVTVTGTRLVISADGGKSWSAIGPTMPYIPAGVIYSAARKAFFIWTWDCGSVVLPNAIEKLDYDTGITAAAPNPAGSSNPA